MVKVRTTIEPDQEHDVSQAEADEMANRGYLFKEPGPEKEPASKPMPRMGKDDKQDEGSKP